MKKIILIMGLIFTYVNCGYKKVPPDKSADLQGHTAPTKFTVDKNKKVLDELPFTDQQDFKDAMKGLIGSEKNLIIKKTDGSAIWDQDAYELIKGVSPESVNPSLWRQSKLNKIHGLFKVTDGIYQLRGYDLANMTIITGKSGWIIVDPLTARQTSARALAFARKHLGNKPITAIIFTHSHVDHFGGVLGIITQEKAVKNGVRIIAPEGFIKEATSENVLAGTTMARRSTYMFGKNLARSKRGHVGSGLGMAPAIGNIGILIPTDVISKKLQKMTVDGIEFIFHNVSGSEAPAEFTFYLPGKRTFCGAEIVSRNMHNLYTLRGAKVRDALAWSSYIEQARNLFGDAEIYFGTHNWPLWGNKRIINFLKKQRDTYKYIHDQTLRLAHSGKTPEEIADMMELPALLRSTFSSRGYYGTVRHNSRAVYQYYFGWFDGNPANLNPLPPSKSAKRYIEFMGGADNVLNRVKKSFDKGEYRWAAEVLNKLVFAEPGNTRARGLLARVYDQLGYQSESGPWRDVYLTGAYELRHGRPEKGIDLSIAKNMLKHTPLERFFEAMAARLNGPDADGIEIKINFIFTDLNETHVVSIENAVLHHYKGKPDPKANATLKLTHNLYLDMALGKAKIKDTLFSNDLKVEGSTIDIIRFFRLLDKPDTNFNIVVP